ncbi:cation:proton antiporter domain-containing protein [Henriciella aquimarina]|uniref:cation:proton antiporter domain-containing protein n=1 Tax=Henriciella aquimarina TaxID=545261 RepID=UPI000A02CBB0|nr:cation:proton antiporter [Henriciella aquimarina]
MGHEGQEIFLKDVLVFLFAAGVIVPAFRALKLPAVAGFLIAGVVLGPHGLGTFEHLWAPLQFVTVSDPEAAAPFAELGVLFLLFLLGLELSFEKLWDMKRVVFGAGGTQAILGATVTGTVLWAFGVSAQAAAVIGLALALSSTAIVMQVLTSEHRAATPAGRTAFGVLLFQDILVAPILIFVSFLSPENSVNIVQTVIRALFEGLLTVAAIVIAGRFVLQHVFRLAARYGGRDFLMALTLFTVIGAAVMTGMAGLSVALGAFLAGLMLGETEFRHQTEVDLDPFKGLLLGIFFMTVGMSIDLVVIAEMAPIVLGGLAGLLLMKALVSWVACRLFAGPAPVATESAFLLAPAGEFAFVIMAAAAGAGILTPELTTPVSAIAGLSMLLIPLTSRLGVSLARRMKTPEPETLQNTDFSDREGHVIIAGFGRVGHTIARILHEEQADIVILERGFHSVQRGRKEGWQVSLGDAARREILEVAGAHGASLFVVTVDDPASAEAMVRAIRSLRPTVPVFARARDAEHGQALRRAGATFVIPDAIEAGLQLAGRALQEFGYANETVRDLIGSERDEEYRKASEG